MRDRKQALDGVGCRTCISRCYTIGVPTTRPRYTITDTGAVQELLDDAEKLWPSVRDRKQLLLALAQAGHDSLGLDRGKLEAADRRSRQLEALSRLPKLVDRELLLADDAWR